MKRKVLSVGAGMMLAAGLVAPAAASAPVCAGTDNTLVVCVDPTGGAPITDCIYVGPPPCVPVSIPGPSVECLGRLGPICAVSHDG